MFITRSPRGGILTERARVIDVSYLATTNRMGHSRVAAWGVSVTRGLARGWIIWSIAPAIENGLGGCLTSRRLPPVRIRVIFGGFGPPQSVGGSRVFMYQCVHGEIFFCADCLSVPVRDKGR